MLKPLDEMQIPTPANNQSSPIYRCHGHWAKRPFNIVRHCIEHFTKTGEIVLDPFAGYGTTGIEALISRRKTIITDLNPISVFVAKVIVMPLPENGIQLYKNTIGQIEEMVYEKIMSLYETTCNCGKKAIVSSVIYDSKNDANDPRERIYHPRVIRIKCPNCGNIRRRPNKDDLKWIKEINNIEIPYWYPKTALVYNTRKSVYKGMTVADLYTKRNLMAMSLLRDAIFRLHEGFCKELMKFTFSAIVRTASMMVHEGGGGWQKSFHIPKKGMAERNVWEIFVRKCKDVIRCKEITQRLIGDYCREAKDFSELEDDKTILITKWDATQISNLIPERSIDYIHTDPPYGDNIQYFELFLPNMAWLGMEQELNKEDWYKEIVITDSPIFPEKSEKHYHELLVKAFVEMSKVIKPMKWITVWFACQDENIWSALRDAITVAGFEERKSYLVIRTSQQKSFGIKRQKTIESLSKILEHDLLVHCQMSGKPKPSIKLPKNVAVELFLKVAEQEIKRRGSATTGEIYMAFVNKCLTEYFTPPPNLNYKEILEGNKHFISQQVTERIGNKYVTIEMWKLKDYEPPSKLTYYLKRNMRVNNED